MYEPFTEEEWIILDDKLVELAEAMTSVLSRSDRLQRDGELGRRLGMVTSYDVLRRRCGWFVDLLAHASARAGADYPDLGRAVKMTRQGAKKRWPDLGRVREEGMDPNFVAPYREGMPQRLPARPLSS